MSTRLRIVSFIVVCVLAVGGAAIYLLNSRKDQQAEAKKAPPVAQVSMQQIQGKAHLIFRNTALGAQYGMVAMVSLADPSGGRAISDTSCDRVYSTTQRILCLSSDRGIVTTYKAEVFNQSFQPEKALPLAGIPSRARLSGDGALAATTSFTAGDSYTNSGFSTRTVISTLAGNTTDANLEDFRLIQNGASIKPADRNFWGVTFGKNDDLFYATVAFNGKTHLVRGSISEHTVTILHDDAECPSLSPDGTHVVYKKRSGQPVGQWRLASYDVATGRETMLSETRSVDDQVEWLDDSTVIYGLPRTGAQAAVDDVFADSIDGTGTPRLLIPQAWSPAVVR